MALGSVPLSARQQLPGELAAAAGAVDRAANYVTVREHYESPDRPPLELIITAKAGAADRVPLLADGARRALATLDDWLGPLEADHLTIVDVPWNSRLVDHDHGDSVIVRSRWLTTSRDRSLERQLIADIARQYWRSSPSGDPFIDGVALYSGGRAIDTILEGSQFHTDRYFGGFLPYSLRSLPLSPHPRDARPRLRRYDALQPQSAAAARIARGLEVAERYIGWPAMQQALSAFRAGPARTTGDFVAVMSVQNGRDLAWLFGDVLRESAAFDYAIGSVDNRADGGEFDVRITIERRGAGIFQQRLPVEITFADGSVLRDTWDAREPQVTLSYVSATPAIAAAIDPDTVLILDERRENNVTRLMPSPWNRRAIQLACNWTIWLQQAMLTYAGLA